MSVPAQKRGKSKQDYGTPREFIDAVESRFGQIHFDLAANETNFKGPAFYDEAFDSLRQDWAPELRSWLNPPYSDIGPWARKCSQTFLSGSGRIFFLVPASVGANWFWDYVWDYATVFALQPRLTFEGCDDPYPKDLIMAVYGMPPCNLRQWRWK